MGACRLSLVRTELRSRYDPIIWVERRGDSLKKVEDVTEELNNMPLLVGDILCPLWPPVLRW